MIKHFIETLNEINTPFDINYITNKITNKNKGLYPNKNNILANLESLVISGYLVKHYVIGSNNLKYKVIKKLTLFYY